MYKGPETTKSTFDFLNYWNALSFKEFGFPESLESRITYFFTSFSLSPLPYTIN